MNTKHHNLKSN